MWSAAFEVLVFVGIAAFLWSVASSLEKIADALTNRQRT
jgi:hypothetical protein